MWCDCLRVAFLGSRGGFFMPARHWLVDHARSNGPNGPTSSGLPRRLVTPSCHAAALAEAEAPQARRRKPWRRRVRDLPARASRRARPRKKNAFFSSSPAKSAIDSGVSTRIMDEAGKSTAADRQRQGGRRKIRFGCTRTTGAPMPHIPAERGEHHTGICKIVERMLY